MHIKLLKIILLENHIKNIGIKQNNMEKKLLVILENLQVIPQFLVEFIILEKIYMKLEKEYIKKLKIQLIL